MQPATTAVILTEAGPEIGYGHLGRCVALAEGLERCRARVKILVRGETPDGMHGMHSLHVTEWLDGSHLDGALSGADLAVVDSYRAPLEVYEYVAANVGTSVWFDDNVRLNYPAGFIVNGSPAAQASDYPENSHQGLLIGPAYQCLRPAFWEVPERSVPRELGRALVVFGGTDVHGLGPKVVQHVRQALPQLDLDVVEAVRTAEEMRDAMLAADVALSAGGQTLYELARTGTPTVCIWVAEHQRAQALAFEGMGTLVTAGGWDDASVLERAVLRVRSIVSPDIRAGMAQAGRTLVDGRGAVRVARIVTESIVTESAKGGHQE